MNKPFQKRRAEPPAEGLPIVAIRRKDNNGWWFAGAATIAAMLLFAALEARRSAKQVEPAVSPQSLAAPETIPALVLPEPAQETQPQAWPEPFATEQPAAPAPTPRTYIVQPVAPPSAGTAPSYQAIAVPPPLMAGTATNSLDAPGRAPLASTEGPRSGRVMAGRLENPASTVIQGTLINAVLETALDSTRAGQARAIVTRDVFGFDGTRLLIPRGTRLYGIYESDVAQGQKRAQIQWTRLLRPDGVSVALDSPAADPLGRAGVEGKVNSHFFQRLGNALLGTTVNIGSALATRNIASPVVLAVPGTAQAAQVVPPSSRDIAPTLTVQQGTRVSVFVQHDLDFSPVEEAP